MMINKITPSVVYNYWSKCFDTTNLEREAVKNQISSLKNGFDSLQTALTVFILISSTMINKITPSVVLLVKKFVNY